MHLIGKVYFFENRLVRDDLHMPARNMTLFGSSLHLMDYHSMTAIQYFSFIVCKDLYLSKHRAHSKGDLLNKLIGG